MTANPTAWDQLQFAENPTVEFARYAGTPPESTTGAELPEKHQKHRTLRGQSRR